MWPPSGDRFGSHLLKNLTQLLLDRAPVTGSATLDGGDRLFRDISDVQRWHDTDAST